VKTHTLRNANGMEIEVAEYGGIILSLRVPDRGGRLEDVVLGFDSVDDYVADNRDYLGALIGRYANRIARGRFNLDGELYWLKANQGPHHLHGGRKGFDTKTWTAELRDDGAGAVALSYTSPAGEEGYPGTLAVRVQYTITDQNRLVIDYHATTDAATPVNLTQHSYFNLGGAGSGPILDHDLMIVADSFTPVDETLIPTGEIRAVEGTPFDFRTPTPIGARIVWFSRKTVACCSAARACATCARATSLAATAMSRFASISSSICWEATPSANSVVTRACSVSTFRSLARA